MALTIRIDETKAGRQIVTPEGVPLDLTLATVYERITAFAIDLIFIGLALLAIALSTLLLVNLAAFEWIAIILRLGVFVLVNGYFIWFELRSSGQTPGKRAMGIRVLSRSGGPLRADAVIARNLMRDVEFFFPLLFVALRPVVFPGMSDWTWLLACAWLGGLALLPAFNADRLRLGDLVAGTWVVRAPKTSLLRDLARRATSAPAVKTAESRAKAAHDFTPEQLEIYGIYELQALEDVLRKHGPGGRELRSAVAGKIIQKIGYEAPSGIDPERFLGDFYAALRAHLERKMLFGARKERKNS
jgi:uncharacterized RDD family membrane protein YckC